MKDNEDNKVILIGVSHHCGLGLVRSFGIHGIRPYGIIIGEKGFLQKSKYWNKVYETETTEQAIEILVKHFSNEKKKPVVIPYFDTIVSEVDNNYDKLSKYFILPTIAGKQGAIVEMMDKQMQYKFAMEHGIKMMKSAIYNLEENCMENNDKVSLPCILKPVASIEGAKFDIEICHTEEEYNKALQKFRNIPRYKRILVQEYLEDRQEICLTGVITATGFVFSLIEKIRIWPNEFGVTSFSRNVKDEKLAQYATNFMDVIKDIGYCGPIDMDLFLDNKGNCYLNEINWRSSGNNFVDLAGGMFTTYLYYLEQTGKKKLNANKINKKEFYCMDEKYDFRHVVIDKDLSMKQWIRDVKNTDSFSVWYKKDVKPALHEYSRLLIAMIKSRSK
jgi:predicted ATP-grasp superfamily ATP-dependent carboligase